jgi:hypothetical protein
MTAAIPPAVTLEFWRHPMYGERWSILEGRRTLLTYPSELEARRVCRANTWIIVRTDALFGEEGERP